MASTAPALPSNLFLDRLRRDAAAGFVVFYIAALAWAPFPLGGAVSWGAGVQEIWIAACWLLWAVSVVGQEADVWDNVRRVLIPIALALLVLAWAIVQTLPIVPANWAHPLWQIGTDVLHKPLPKVVSLNPWHTEAETLKLASYAMACWLAFYAARRGQTASLLLNAVIVTGAGYALYAFALDYLDVVQPSIFYAMPVHTDYVSGPFMLHNSFATYCGLATVAAVGKFIALGSESWPAGRSSRAKTLAAIQLVFGRGAFALLAVILCFAGVVMSASRAGFLSTMCGLTAMAAVALIVRRRGSRYRAAFAVAAICLLLVGLVVSGGDVLGMRLNGLLDAGTADQVRLALWTAAARMISDSPWVGLGLGTFPDAYPLYASQILPFVMDKAHCDYLEFAAGLGLPAAILWWSALVWLWALCLRATWIRNRNRVYPIVAIGASVVVALHSCVDFSLQLPAVALLYATLLGIGVGQAFPTRK